MAYSIRAFASGTIRSAGSESQADSFHRVSQHCKFPRVPSKYFCGAPFSSLGLLFAVVAVLCLAVNSLLRSFIRLHVPLIQMTTDGYVWGSNYSSDG